VGNGGRAKKTKGKWRDQNGGQTSAWLFKSWGRDTGRGPSGRKRSFFMAHEMGAENKEKISMVQRPRGGGPLRSRGSISNSGVLDWERAFEKCDNVVSLALKEGRGELRRGTSHVAYINNRHKAALQTRKNVHCG